MDPRFAPKSDARKDAKDSLKEQNRLFNVEYSPYFFSKQGWYHRLINEKKTLLGHLRDDSKELVVGPQWQLENIDHLIFIQLDQPLKLSPNQTLEFIKYLSGIELQNMLNLSEEIYPIIFDMGLAKAATIWATQGLLESDLKRLKLIETFSAIKPIISINMNNMPQFDEFALMRDMSNITLEDGFAKLGKMLISKDEDIVLLTAGEKVLLSFAVFDAKIRLFMQAYVDLEIPKGGYDIESFAKKLYDLEINVERAQKRVKLGDIDSLLAFIQHGTNIKMLPLERLKKADSLENSRVLKSHF